MKTVAILQPAYLPWLGFFERIALADEVIVLDHVCLDPNSKTKFAHRNRVRTPQDWTWLTVPILSRGRGKELALDRILIEEDGRWRAKHWATIEQNYRRAPFFERYGGELQAVYANEWAQLLPLCSSVTRSLMRALGIDTPLISSSTLQSRTSKSDLLLDLCIERNATHYLSGPFGRDYLDLAAFARAGVALQFHDYRHPIYAQSFAGFQPCMFAYDLLFHAGPGARALMSTTRELRAA